MSYLANLAVEKVSFVRRAANKRTFTLLKADSCTGGSSSATGEKDGKKKTEDVVEEKEVKNDTTNTQKGEITMSEEKTASTTATTNPPAPVADATKTETTATQISKEAELIAQNKNLTERLEKMEKDSKRRDIISWLSKECPFLPDSAEKVADEIMKLDAVSPEIATSFKENLKKSSEIVSQSKLFKESGVTTDSLLKAESDGFDLVRKVAQDYNTLKKADGSKPLSATQIANIIRSHGAGDYSSYREAHLLRSKTQAI